jgi:hypothetical protein
VTIRVSAGRKAEPYDRQAAKATRELLADELTRVRASALAWRNGLGALLAGLIGFSLIKGRSDITQLSPVYATVVGCLLLASLAAGGTAAILIMRAAHGRPYALSLHTLVDSSVADPAEAARQAEASASERALRWGVVLCFACVALLTSAVGVTWYGPSKSEPLIEVQLPNGTTQCGEIVSLSAGQLTLKTSPGQVTVDLTQADGMAAVDSCTPSQG